MKGRVQNSLSITTADTSNPTQVHLDDERSTPSTPGATSIYQNVPTSSEANIDELEDMVEEEDVLLETSPNVGGKRKRTSSVWTHFTKKDVKGEDMAVCNHCKKSLSGKSGYGTTHLRKHLKNSCPLLRTRDIRQSFITSQATKDGKQEFGTYVFDHEVARKDLASMIVLHEYPLSIVEHVGFKKFCFSLQPMFKIISRNTVKSDILKLYNVEKIKAISLLDSNKSRVAVTTDLWTASNQKKHYMVITAHYIDHAWKLQSRIIRFVHLLSPQTAEVLSNTLHDTLMDWNIDGKLSTLTVDNCSTNDSMINKMKKKIDNNLLLGKGKLLHMRCAAHILNLIVREGFDHFECGIEKVRDSVSYWTHTPKRLEKFEETAAQLNLKITKTIALDCKTRWNSTYTMMSTALPYKRVFFRLGQRDPSYQNVPAEDDWSVAKELCDRLERFNEITKLFSGTEYPTANLFFLEIAELKLSLYEWENSHREEIRNMAFPMIEKFKKYWDDISGILTVANVLDPRFKMSTIKCYFPIIYKDRAQAEIRKVYDSLNDLASEYEASEAQLSQSAHRAYYSSSSNTSSATSRKYKYDDWCENNENDCDVVVKTELDAYLEEAKLPRVENFDILSWWRSNGVKFPTLQRIARDIYAVPMSTVASESAFSTSGRVVHPHRSRLLPTTIEALMCTQDWLWAEMKETSKSDDGVALMYWDDGDTNSSDISEVT